MLVQELKKMLEEHKAISKSESGFMVRINVVAFKPTEFIKKLERFLGRFNSVVEHVLTIEEEFELGKILVEAQSKGNNIFTLDSIFSRDLLLRLWGDWYFSVYQALEVYQRNDLLTEKNWHKEYFEVLHFPFLPRDGHHLSIANLMVAVPVSCRLYLIDLMKKTTVGLGDIIKTVNELVAKDVCNLTTLSILDVGQFHYRDLSTTVQYLGALKAKNFTHPLVIEIVKEATDNKRDVIGELDGLLNALILLREKDLLNDLSLQALKRRGRQYLQTAEILIRMQSENLFQEPYVRELQGQTSRHYPAEIAELMILLNKHNELTEQNLALINCHSQPENSLAPLQRLDATGNWRPEYTQAVLSRREAANIIETIIALSKANIPVDLAACCTKLTISCVAFLVKNNLLTESNYSRLIALTSGPIPIRVNILSESGLCDQTNFDRALRGEFNNISVLHKFIDEKDASLANNLNSLFALKPSAETISPPAPAP